MVDFSNPGNLRFCQRTQNQSSTGGFDACNEPFFGGHEAPIFYDIGSTKDQRSNMKKKIMVNPDGSAFEVVATELPPEQAKLAAERVSTEKRIQLLQTQLSEDKKLDAKESLIMYDRDNTEYMSDRELQKLSM